ncbi:MAG: hypothetical protein QOD07_1573 [Frankiaceae bacterium]|nr:hypothetical protein [Frankiaceae bacterium]
MSVDAAAPVPSALRVVPAGTTTKSVPLVALPGPLSLRTERTERSTKTRNGSIDALRIGAILAVITIHTVSPLTAAAVVPRYSAAWWLGTIWNVSALWCVPVFVMISGSLVLTRPIESATAFYRRRLQRIGIPLVFWSALYLLLRATVFHERLTGSTAAHDVARGQPFLQMYYLFVIAGLYVVAPAVQIVLRHVGDRRLATLALVVLAADTFDYTLKAFFEVGGTNALTEWVPFLGYFLAGAWIARRSAALTLRGRRWLYPAVFFAAAGLTIVLTAVMCARFGWTGAGRYFLGYQSPTVVVMSLAVFAWVTSRAATRQRRPRKWLSQLGTATFGVFLVHPLFLVPLFLHVQRPHDVLSVTLLVPAAVLAIWVLSTALTLGASRVPVVRRLVS